MIVTTETFNALKIVAMGGFVVAIIAGFVFIPKDLDRTSERARKLRRNILVVLALLILTGVLGFGVEPFGAPLVVVKILPDGNVQKVGGRLFGTQTYAFQDGHTETMKNDGDTLVVNDSTTIMRVDTQSYGDPMMALARQLVGSESEVAPMKITTLHHAIDFVGRDDPPPHAVSGVYAEERYWLVW